MLKRKQKLQRILSKKRTISTKNIDDNNDNNRYPETSLDLDPKCKKLDIVFAVNFSVYIIL